MLGDNKATNSIGKSTLLMIVDFIFGGSTYLEHNRDVIQELGEHEYKFEFEFNGEPYYFIRSTKNKLIVYKCDSQYNVVNELSTAEYTSFLKNKYNLGTIDLSFREIIGLFFRVWGKPNYFVKKPLQLFDKDIDKKAIVRLLKLFEKYNLIAQLNDKITNEKELKTNFNKAVRDELIPNVTKTEFKKNSEIIKSVENELEDIKNNLLKYTINTSELVNKELIEFKKEKEDLLKIKFRLNNKRERLISNLNQKNPIKSRQLNQLTEFFPSSNVDKIVEIEQFHTKISKILKKEFTNEKEHIEERLLVIQNEIDEIDFKIKNLLGDTGNPIKVVNRIYDLTFQAKELKQKEETYKRKDLIQLNITKWNEELEEKAKKLTDDISELINKELIRINDKVHIESRTAPRFFLSKDRYSFELPKNTGTGKAFIDLVNFDLAIFNLTRLPVLIHDSFLFKNIENSSLSNLAKLYHSHKKQTFIAIDEINKYDIDAQIIFKANKCLELDNTNLLFIKDWREKS
ncbi:MAG: DUF2326 domain-containing protein [Bacteroidales bacterium]|nr:DUF2326 domain-containing protein [Bacteroidales bacterium]